MEGVGASRFDNAVRKKRSNTSRRPRSDSKPFPDNRSVSSTPPSENVSKFSSDEHSGFDTSSRRKKLILNQHTAVDSSGTRYDGDSTRKKIRKVTDFEEMDPVHRSGSSRGKFEQGKYGSDYKRSCEGSIAPSNSKNKLSESQGLRRVKLKVGGVTRTIHTTSSIDANQATERSYLKDSRPSDAVWPRQKLGPQDISDEDQSPPKKPSDLRAIPWENFFGDSDPKKKETLGTKIPDDKIEPVRKSRRVPKRRVLDGSFEDGDEDDEIRYLEKLRNHRSTADVVYGSSKSGRDGKKSRPERLADTDFVEEEELTSDADLEEGNKKLAKENVDVPMEGKREMTLTTRQRALQSGKDVSPGSGGNLIEFPNGLPPAPSRKQKEKLTEVEVQLKKEEAARRRRVQVEKAYRESEAEAIRKILGQDSSRKKREDKNKKRQEELQQERAANATTLAPNTIRYVSGPSGNVLIFPKDEPLPIIFNSKPISYPPPREKCAGPSCTNAYVYRDAKSQIPLCSLQCYRAVNGQTGSASVPTC